MVDAMTPVLRPSTYRVLLLITVTIAVVFSYLLREHRLLFIGLGVLFGVLLAVLWCAALSAAPREILQTRTHREFDRVLRSNWQGKAYAILGNVGVVLIGVAAWRVTPSHLLEAIIVGCGSAAAISFAVMFITARRVTSSAGT